MIEKRDVLAVMAAGYGKSLCFQFPAVYENGIVLVISPLISLMLAQVLALNNAKIPACLVGEAQTETDIISRINKGEINIIYSSPKYLGGYQGKKLLNMLQKQNRLILIAIDESHCISEWGLDYNPSFRLLNIRSVIPKVPILALTSTATEKIRHDIKTSLGLINPKVITSTSFDRPNLKFIVHKKTNVWDDLGPWVTNTTGSVVVYLFKIAHTEEIARKLQTHGVDCQPYHGEMNVFVKKQVVEAFMEDQLKVIVATTASFGMGIDKKDVRTVVHYGPSRSLESYYREVGRAGRDGLPSKVVTYFDIDDLGLLDWVLEEENKKQKFSIIVKEFRRDLAFQFRKFLHSTECHRQIILEHLNECTSESKIRSDCCDNCEKRLSSWKICDDDYKL